MAQIFLPAGSAITITADAFSAGTARRVAQPGTTTNYAAESVAASAILIVGPFATDRTYDIVSTSGTLAAAIAVPDFTTYQVRSTSVTAMTTSATITTAALLGGIITANQAAAGAATYTMPTGTVMDAALPASFGIGKSFDFSICNISTVGAEDVTLAGDTGMTAVGNLFVASNAATTDKSSATFRVLKTAAATFSFYRIG